MSIASLWHKWRLIHALADDAATAGLLRTLFWHRYQYPGASLLRKILPIEGGLQHLRLCLQGAARPVELNLRALDPGDIASLFENLVEFDVRSLFQTDPRFVVDAGAHIGVFSVLVSAYFPHVRILAIEPNQANVEVLKRNFRDNRINGEVQPVALWNENTLVGFSAQKSNAGRVKAGSGCHQVQARTLSSLVGEELAQVDFLKLDVEGAELIVLPEVLPRLSQNACVYVELHDAARHAQVFQDICSSSGWLGKRVHQYPPHEMWLLRHSSAALLS